MSVYILLALLNGVCIGASRAINTAAWPSKAAPSPRPGGIIWWASCCC